MKRPVILSFRLFLVLILLIITADSCKKSYLPVQGIASLSTLPDDKKVNATDINIWINKFLPVAYQGQLQLSNAQQNVINGQHVVKVPIGKDAALFFTKTDGVLQAYAYKWLNKDPGAANYTGYITAYSFQTSRALQTVYKASQIITQNYLTINMATKAIGVAQPTNLVTPIKPASRGLTTFDTGDGNIFVQFWCFLTGGFYITQFMIDYEDYQAPNGDIGPGCDRSGRYIGSDDEPGNNGGFFTGLSSPPGDPGFGSTPGSGDGGNYGGGPSWVDPGAPTGDGCDLNGNCSGSWTAMTLTGPDLQTIAEPALSDTFTDPTTGITLSYNDIVTDFENNPQYVDDVLADETVQISGGPALSVVGLQNGPAVANEFLIIQRQHPDWSTIRIVSLAAWNVWSGKVHFLLDVAGFVPVIGDAASLVNGGIYFLEGDKVNCALSLVAAIPVTGWVSIAGKWIKTTTASVPIAEAAGKIAYKAIQVGKDIRLVKVAVNAFDYAAVKALELIRPADQTLTNLARALVDRYGYRFLPTEANLQAIVTDIVQNGDNLGTKTEALADAVFQRDGYVKQISQYGSNNGFDGVYIQGSLSSPTDIIINEAKQIGINGNIKLAAAGNKAAQMSDQWIDQTINEMVNNPNQSQSIVNLGNYLLSHRTLINKTVTAVDKSTGEIVILGLQRY